ncbi:hexameric tyrosine-coordinated heme protein [Ornithinimicrobium kibberense]
MARKSVGAIQPDAEMRQAFRPGYAGSADSLTMAAQVVAIEFATIAAANGYWR